MAHSLIRFWFCVTVALLAVSLANPLIELMSNAGVFGADAYTDHSIIDLAPTFCAGVLFLTVHVFQRIRGMLAYPREPTRSQLHAWGKALDRAKLPRLIPYAFALQILILYVMETLEQCVTAGHPLGGAVWLGGPVFLSLFIHAAFCAVMLLFVGRNLHALSGTVVRIVRLIRELVTRVIGGRPNVLSYRLDFPAHAYRLLVLCRIGERAPPSVVA